MPTGEEKRVATELVLGGLARGVDVFELAGELLPLHPKNNTFPGEVFLSVAVDALEIGGFSQDQPLDFEGLVERHLPDVRLRGRNDHRKSFYALMTPPALRGGVAPDLLGEIQWWATDDYWQFVLFALLSTCVQQRNAWRFRSPMCAGRSPNGAASTSHSRDNDDCAHAAAPARSTGRLTATPGAGTWSFRTERNRAHQCTKVRRGRAALTAR
jgi:hypothetical protein